MSKLLGRFVATLLLVSMVAACGPSGDRTAATTATTGAAVTTEPTTAAVTAEPTTAETTAPAETATMMEETATTTMEETATAGTDDTATAATDETATTTAGGVGAVDLASLSGDVVIDGSSTVEPISLAVAEEFGAVAPNVNVAVGRSGTGGGFEKFCNGETDINDASRAIRDTENEACTANNVEPVELQVGVDALAVVTSSANTFITCLTGEQMDRVFQEGGATTWNEIDPAFPSEPIEIFAPDADSGTFDYFTEALELRGAEEEEPEFKGDYTASADDNVLVQGIEGSANSIGFFGYAFFAENQDGLKAIEVDLEGSGTCVAPSQETVQDNSYPLSRPLFIYPSRAALEKPEVRAFVEYYLSDEGLALVEEVDYFPATAEQIQTSRQNLSAATQ